MQKWEYLRVNIREGNDSFSSHIKPVYVAVIGNDDKVNEWKKQQLDTSHQSVVTRLLTKLGDEGWELVGIYPKTDSVLYFKRPKE